MDVTTSFATIKYHFSQTCFVKSFLIGRCDIICDYQKTILPNSLCNVASDWTSEHHLSISCHFYQTCLVVAFLTRRHYIIKAFFRETLIMRGRVAQGVAGLPRNRSVANLNHSFLKNRSLFYDVYIVHNHNIITYLYVTKLIQL